MARRVCRDEARKSSSGVEQDDFTEEDIFEMEEDYAARLNRDLRRRSDRTGLPLDEESEEEDGDPWVTAPTVPAHSFGCEESGDSMMTDESTTWKEEDTPRAFEEVADVETAFGSGATLSDLGLHFGDDGLLYVNDTGRRLDTSKFQATTTYMDTETKKKFEVILGAVRREVYHLILSYGLRAYRLLNAPSNVESLFFASPQFDSASVMALLLQGSGTAGQWDSRLVLHEGLNVGSQLPFIRECGRRKWAVVIANPRIREGVECDEQHTDQSSVQHVLSLWEHFITKSHAASFAIFAHRYGGFLAEEILHRFIFCTRLRAVCVCEWNTRLGWPPTATPSVSIAVHSASSMDGLVGSLPSGGMVQQVRGGRSPPSSSSGWWPHCVKMTRLWVPSARPVGAREKVREGVRCLSGGTKHAEKIPSTAMDSMFEYVEQATHDEETLFFGWSR